MASGASTPTGGSLPPATSASSANNAGAATNKMFSLVEVTSGEYMKVEMPPPFMKQELSDVDLMQYPVSVLF